MFWEKCSESMRRKLGLKKIDAFKNADLGTQNGTKELTWKQKTWWSSKGKSEMNSPLTHMCVCVPAWPCLWILCTNIRIPLTTKDITFMRNGLQHLRWIFFSLLASVSLFCFLVPLFPLGVSLLPHCLSCGLIRAVPFLALGVVPWYLSHHIPKYCRPVIGSGEPKRSNGTLAGNAGAEHSLPTHMQGLFLSSLLYSINQFVDPCANTTLSSVL